MPQFIVDGIEGATSEDTADRIIPWLEARGYVNPQVSTSFSLQTGLLRVVVDTDRDPTADLLTYASTPTARQVFDLLALTDALPLIRAIALKARADRTPVEKVLLGLAVAVREVMEQVDTP